MLYIIAMSLLTLGVFASIFLASYVRLWKSPPTIEVNMPPIEVTLVVPDNITLIHQNLPAKIETDKPTDEPIPEDILEYISLESDQWAQEARKRRARMLKAETGDWDVVFRMLQKEDQ